MKWILVLPCVLWSNTVILATSGAQPLGQLNDHQQEVHYRQSSQRFYDKGKLEGDLLNFATSSLKKAIDLRKIKLGLRAKMPLSAVKQKELEDLRQRRAVLQQAGQDLYNEKLQRLEKLEAKFQIASRFKNDFLLLGALDKTDHKIEALEKGDEEGRKLLIQKRNELAKGLSAKGACVFRLKTSLGVLQHYLLAEDWSDVTSVLHNVIGHIQSRIQEAMSNVYVTIPGEAISSNKAIVLEGLLQTMPPFLTAINRFIRSFDREMVVAISLSNRPDLVESYEAEIALEDHPTENLLYALGVLGRYRPHDHGFEGSTKELEEQIQSLDAAIVIIKDQEAERIRQIMNQNPPIDLVSSEKDSEEDIEESGDKDSHGSSNSEVEVGAAGEPQNVLAQNNAGMPDHPGGAGVLILPAVPDVPAVLEEPAEDVIPDEENGGGVQEAPVTLNAIENLDTDTYFGQFQTGAHLAAFIKIKNMENQKGVLSAFLESARQEETRKYQDPKFWKLNLWMCALEKGLLNIAQIQPVIKMLQELVILGEEG